MHRGICVYAECDGIVPIPAVAELVTAARSIAETTGEPVQALVIAERCGEAAARLERLGVDEIYTVETGRSYLFQDDAQSRVAASALKAIKPSALLIPARASARSLFSRTAILMETGLTADCTKVTAVGDETGKGFRLRQDKPSFGENVMVSILTKDARRPQMMTIREGVYPPAPECAASGAKTFRLDGIELPDSKIKLLGTSSREEVGEDISGAPVVCVAGRGALEGERLSLVREFAARIGAVVAGTRPLADEGAIPFENQIGQTGKTIRPCICVSFGVSGAIQHTEGIKETKLFIAVNNDENAAIWGAADYGAISDMEDILRCAIRIAEAED